MILILYLPLHNIIRLLNNPDYPFSIYDENIIFEELNLCIDCGWEVIGTL